MSPQNSVTRTLFARGSHADNIEAGVHVVHLTRDSGCQWRAKVNRGVANICRANVAAQRGGCRKRGLQLAKVRHAGGCQRANCIALGSHAQPSTGAHASPGAPKPHAPARWRAVTPPAGSTGHWHSRDLFVSVIPPQRSRSQQQFLRHQSLYHGR